MKVISWNCNMAFRKKAARILESRPDLLVVPECECPEKQRFATEIQQPEHRLWIGDNSNKGLGVFSYADFHLDFHELYDPSLKYVVPVKVSGERESFTLLAVWAMNDEEDRKRRYIGQVWLAINKYESLLDTAILIVGDFNWNKIWDKSPGLHGNLSHIVDFLKSKGIVSLYHSFFGEAFGQESHPTLYLYRKRSRTYHVDYIFASKNFADQLQMIKVGTYENWKALSDHMPIIATLGERGVL